MNYCLGLFLVILNLLLGIGECFQNFGNSRFYQLQQQHLRALNSFQQPNNDLLGGNAAQVHGFGFPEPVTTEPVKNFVTVVSPPKNVSSDMELKVKFQCNRHLVIAIFIDGYEDEDDLLRNSTDPHLVNDPRIIYKVAWKCSYSTDVKHYVLKINLPHRFLYTTNGLMPKPSMMEDVKLKVFMCEISEWYRMKLQADVVRNKLHLLYENSKLKLKLPLTMIPPMQRPERKLNKTLSWQTDLLNSLAMQKPWKSVVENECSTTVKYPIFLSEETYGIIQSYYPFYNPELKRNKKSNKIRFTLTMEMYLHSWCKTSAFCSIMQHVDSENKFESPVVMITQQGKLHIQMKLKDGQSYAHSPTWPMPLEQWIRLDIVQMNTLTNVTMFYGENYTKSLNYSGKYHMPVMFEESNGFLSFGGTLFAKNFNGIISFAKFCRNRALTPDKVHLPKRPDPINDRFLKVYQKQQRVLKNAVTKRWLSQSDKRLKKHGVSVPYFLEIIQNCTRSRQELYGQSSLDEKPMSLHLEKVEKILGGLSTTLNVSSMHRKVGEELYNIFLEKLNNPETIRNMSQNIRLLKQSSRLGHTLSNYFLYAIYKNGVGVPRDLTKARFHLLVGAHKSDRLCLKALGYNHKYGLCGFPKDMDIAFMYYFNVAHKTQRDLMDHSGELVAVNNARLSDEKHMKDQLSEDDDIFQWLKHQASKGAYKAQRNMARLMYWGQQGIERNLNAAFKYYEEAAKGGDPVALYDYGLVLMKGHGVTADEARGVEVLNQAADLNSPAALNTLGWYYATKDVNATKAAGYFERSEKLGSVDAIYNLGHMYHMGTYPGKGKDMKKAIEKYYKAASGGHIESAVQIAYFASIGIQGVFARNIFMATEWAQYLTERNPSMGLLIKHGLQAYRKKDWAKSLFLYLAVADSGFEVAQFNTAFLCEEDKGELVNSIKEECVWKNWNASSLTRMQHPYAINKMGDYYYYGHGGEVDLDRAVTQYVIAAKREFPQAVFNLANILENHDNVEVNRTIEELPLPKEAFNSREDAIVHLYRKCTNMQSRESVIPCYMALIRTQTILLWNRTSIFAKIITLVVIILTTIILIWINLLRKRRLNTLLDQMTAEQDRIENGSISLENASDEENNSNTEPLLPE